MTYPYMPAATGESAIREWERLTTAILGATEAVYDSMARPLRLWERNGLADLVAATTPLSLVGDSGLTREQVVARSVVFQALLQWLMTPLVAGFDEAAQPIHVVPMDLLSQR